MSVQVIGIIGKATLSSGVTKVLFQLQLQAPIPTLPSLQIPPPLPSLPIPSLPSLKVPSFGLNFNPPKYATDIKIPTVAIKLPNLSLAVPSLQIPPPLPSLPIPSLPSLKAPDFGLNFNPPKYATDIKIPTVAIKPPSLSLSIPGLQIPPPLPSLPIPSLPSFPSLSPSSFAPYFNINLPYPTLLSAAPSITPYTRVE